MTGPLDPEKARELLRQAELTASTTREVGTWTPVALLLTMGAASSLALVGMWLAGPGLLALPMTLFFVWMAIGFAIHLRFARSAKRGFGRRWLVTIGLWVVAWTFGVFTTADGAIGDNVYWVSATALAITAITAIGAWIEATR